MIRLDDLQPGAFVKGLVGKFLDEVVSQLQAFSGEEI